MPKAFLKNKQAAASKVAPMGQTPLGLKRYDENGKLDPMGTLDKHGFPLPAASLPMTAAARAAEASKAKSSAAAALKEKEEQSKAARRAGYSK